jgi:hypothetical protein
LRWQGVLCVDILQGLCNRYCASHFVCSSSVDASRTGQLGELAG